MLQEPGTIVSTHWKPTTANLTMCQATPQVALHEAYEDTVAPRPNDDGVWPSPPLPVTQRTLIIWMQKECMACQLNKGFFAQLEKQTDVMRVVRVEYTGANMAAYNHVGSLPKYDVVTPSPGSNSPYGPNTSLHSIRNDEREQLFALGFRRFTA